MALMLTYKHGSARFAMERYFCPQLSWIGLYSEDVARLRRRHAASDQGGEEPLSDMFQPFTARDRAFANGLMRRPEVEKDRSLLREAAEMLRAAQKLEIEALQSLGPTALVDYVVEKVVVLGGLGDASQVNDSSY
uniref:Topoisomerase 6 subunit A/Spo11 TOPRIM domain-containing protein n=1 Tax=Calcidiscus leptoporus TaxID=127549 RepID=A0A7S0JB82_9EUKA